MKRSVRGRQCAPAAHAPPRGLRKARPHRHVNQSWFNLIYELCGGVLLIIWGPQMDLDNKSTTKFIWIIQKLFLVLLFFTEMKKKIITLFIYNTKIQN